MMPLSFRAFLAESQVGTVKGPRYPDQIDQLDRGLRRLAATDPLIASSRILRAYATGLPLPSDEEGF